ncbi:MAG: ActS/PrrB/RegB family redox-sensitive histidine kinase [Parvularculaceae bacterium]|nr:ActS/PrrB/RegB family redox-sensitive histidine kinase [Parvularculaceae bacterium]
MALNLKKAIAEADIAAQAVRGPIRLRTLTTLRWLAVAGQLSAILIVHFALAFPVPLGLCLGVIAASAWLNIFISLRFSPRRYLADREATAYIAFDIAQLCALLFLTGGLQNPFSVLILAPVTIAASVLPVRLAVLIGSLAFAGISLLAGYHLPLPWREGEAVAFPPVLNIGVWVALSFAVAFFGAYAHRIAAEAAQLKSALAASQLVLAREERLAALGGLAAAAAHELGTPLATIQLTAKEMAGELKGQGLLEDDAKLLVSQAQRCRDILGRLSDRGEAGDIMMDRIAVDLLLKEAAGPFLDARHGPAVIFDVKGGAEGEAPPVLQRRPEIIYGLRNLIENAVGYARSKVLVSAHWSKSDFMVEIHDDGPGFSLDMLARLGEPYLGGRSRGSAKKGGLGLGFFIAKTLLERTGASVAFDNKAWDEAAGGAGAPGAWVAVTWPRAAIFAREA